MIWNITRINNEFINQAIDGLKLFNIFLKQFYYQYIFMAIFNLIKPSFILSNQKLRKYENLNISTKLKKNAFIRVF